MSRIQGLWDSPRAEASSVGCVLSVIAFLGCAPPIGIEGKGDAAPAAAVGTAPAPSDTREADRRLQWGIYHILHWQAYGRTLDAEIGRLGSRPDYVMFFRDLDRPYPRDICRLIIERGATPMISLELVRWHAGNGKRLDAIVRGEYDEFFTRYAREAAGSNQHVLFRFGFEMNGNWFAWGNQPEAFKTAWRRVHDIFREQGCRNLKWVWAPNAVSIPDTPDNGIEKYWPGDEYVDLIGLDGYNFGDDHGQGHTWRSCEEIFTPALDKIRASGVSQPVIITEFGCARADPDRRAAWIRDAHRFFSSRREIIGAIWFHFDKRREGEPNWRIDADPESLRAWRETFIGTEWK